MIEALLKEPRKLLFLVLPGFLSQRIAEFYTAGFRGEAHDRVLIAVAFTLVNLALLALVSRDVRRGFSSDRGIRLSAPVVGGLLLISVATGVVGGMIADSAWPLRFGLTKRTSQYSVWVTTMRHYKECKEDQVIVRVKDGGGLFYGQIGWYSNDSEAHQLYLKPAWRIVRASPTEPEFYTNNVSVLDGGPRGQTDRYRIDGLLLRGDQIVSIEFIRKEDAAECRK